MFKLKRTKQCPKCPWRKDVDPHDIPNGYSVEKHKNLSETIAKDDIMSQLSRVNQPLHIMACHETDDAHCLGWLVNQIEQGNNIQLRIQMLSCSNYQDIQLIGDQHDTFEKTLPND